LHPGSWLVNWNEGFLCLGVGRLPIGTWDVVLYCMQGFLAATVDSGQQQRPEPRLWADVRQVLGPWVHESNNVG
jgi:hypothetical protein